VTRTMNQFQMWIRVRKDIWIRISLLGVANPTGIDDLASQSIKFALIRCCLYMALAETVKVLTAGAVLPKVYTVLLRLIATYIEL
jgi:hypothetical protein